jgi:two-component system, LytTR family, sensor kinase
VENKKIMKVRWSSLVQTFFVVVVLVKTSYLVATYSNTNKMLAYIARFESEGIHFQIFKNAILPQCCTLILFYLAYLATNHWILPKVNKLSFDNFDQFDAQNTFSLLVPFYISVFSFALGVNTITYFAKPYLFNYADFQMLAILGYNDTPLQDIYFGFGRAFFLILGLLTYCFIRDLGIKYLEKPSPKQEYKILVTNNILTLVMFYFLGLIIYNPVHNDFLRYFANITPMMVLYLYFTFWLFPKHDDNPWTPSKNTENDQNQYNKTSKPPRSIYKKILLVTFIGSLLQLQGYLFMAQPLGFPLYWVFLLFVFTPICWLLFQNRKEKIMQLRGMERALTKSKADLQFLRSQINPHFLFNALNTLYGTALLEGAQNTSEGIQKLGDMMRFMLHENNQDFISMQKECEYLKNYIALQKMRIQNTSNIIISDNIEENACNHAIAPMLLIPLVENAFKHGISLQGKSWIDIHLVCTSNRVDFEVKNSLHKNHDNDPENEQSGIGLVNVWERLKLIYPNQYEFNYGVVGNEFIAKLSINY